MPLLDVDRSLLVFSSFDFCCTKKSLDVALGRAAAFCATSKRTWLLKRSCRTPKTARFWCWCGDIWYDDKSQLFRKFRSFDLDRSSVGSKNTVRDIKKIVLLCQKNLRILNSECFGGGDSRTFAVSGSSPGFSSVLSFVACPFRAMKKTLTCLS